MIAGYFHEGSGLGNQLFRYVMARTLAKDKGYMFGMLGDFKGDSFMELDKGVELVSREYYYWHEKKITQDGIDIRGYDPEINFVRDNTIIDGEFQDPRYWEHRLNEINEWLKVEPIKVPDDVCLIGFRGGEYSLFPDLFLTPEYWAEGIDMMLEINPNMKFEVHTDDKELAQKTFPDFKVIQDIGTNWSSMRHARHAIISNSSFYIFPRLLSKGITIAPRYWARRNVGTWALPQNYYKQFTFI